MPGVVPIDPRDLQVLRVPRGDDGDVVVVREGSGDSATTAAAAAIPPTIGIGVHDPVVQPLLSRAHVRHGLDAAVEVVVEHAVAVVGPEQDDREPARRRRLRAVIRDDVVARVVPMSRGRVALQERVDDSVLLVLVKYGRLPTRETSIVSKEHSLGSSRVPSLVPSLLPPLPSPFSRPLIPRAWVSNFGQTTLQQ